MVHTAGGWIVTADNSLNLDTDNYVTYITLLAVNALEDWAVTLNPDAPMENWVLTLNPNAPLEDKV